jgi:hypothetical protein
MKRARGSILRTLAILAVAVGVARGASPEGYLFQFTDRFPGATLRDRVAAAAADCGGAPCPIVIPPGEAPPEAGEDLGVHALPSNAWVIDLRGRGESLSTGVWLRHAYAADLVFRNDEGSATTGPEERDVNGALSLLAVHDGGTQQNYCPGTIPFTGAPCPAGSTTYKDAFQAFKLTAVQRGEAETFGLGAYLEASGRGDAYHTLDVTHYGNCADHGDECVKTLRAAWNEGTEMPLAEVTAVSRSDDGRDEVVLGSASLTNWIGQDRLVLDCGSPRGAVTDCRCGSWDRNGDGDPGDDCTPDPRVAYSAGRIAAARQLPDHGCSKFRGVAACADEGGTRVEGTGVDWGSLCPGGSAPCDPADLCLVLGADTNREYRDDYPSLKAYRVYRILSPTTLWTAVVAQGYFSPIPTRFVDPYLSDDRYTIFRCGEIAEVVSLDGDASSPGATIRTTTPAPGSGFSFRVGDHVAVPVGSARWGAGVGVVQRAYAPPPRYGIDGMQVLNGFDAQEVRGSAAFRVEGGYRSGVQLDGAFDAALSASTGSVFFGNRCDVGRNPMCREWTSPSEIAFRSRRLYTFARDASSPAGYENLADAQDTDVGDFAEARVAPGTAARTEVLRPARESEFGAALPRNATLGVAHRATKPGVEQLLESSFDRGATWRVVARSSTEWDTASLPVPAGTAYGSIRLRATTRCSGKETGAGLIGFAHLSLDGDEDVHLALASDATWPRLTLAGTTFEEGGVVTAAAVRVGGQGSRLTGTYCGAATVDPGPFAGPAWSRSYASPREGMPRGAACACSTATPLVGALTLACHAEEGRLVVGFLNPEASPRDQGPTVVDYCCFGK